MLYNFNDWQIYDGAAEGSGRSEKVWLINPSSGEHGLFKFPKSELTTEHISEKISCELANLIGLPSAKIDIGLYQNRIGSMSYSINKPNEALIEGVSFITKLFPNYNPNELVDVSSGEYYSIDMISQSVEDHGLFSDILPVMVFDFLIGNSDRHHGNWAALRLGDVLRISPIYDNGSSLCCYIPEQDITSYLGNDKVRLKSLIDTGSVSCIKINSLIKKRPTHLEVLKYISQKYKYEVHNILKNFLEKVSLDSVTKILDTFSDELISDNRKKLINVFINEKLRLMREVFESEV